MVSNKIGTTFTKSSKRTNMKRFLIATCIIFLASITQSKAVLPVGQKVILHKYTTEQFPIFGGWYDPYQEIVGHKYTVLSSTTYVVDGVTYVVYQLTAYLTTDPDVMWPESALTLAFGGGISRAIEEDSRPLSYIPQAFDYVTPNQWDNFAVPFPVWTDPTGLPAPYTKYISIVNKRCMVLQNPFTIAGGSQLYVNLQIVATGDIVMWPVNYVSPFGQTQDYLVHVL